MPHNPQIHLPSWETQKDVYTRYAEDMKLQQLQPSDILSLSMFYKVWKDEFSHVVIPEVSFTVIHIIFNGALNCMSICIPHHPLP